MKHLTKISLIAAVFAIGTIAQSAHHEESEMPIDIHDIMEVGMKGDRKTETPSLTKKVLSGDASIDEKKDLLAMFLSLEKFKVEKGEQEAFDKKADALTDAMIGVMVGVDGSLDKLEEAANCKACHSAHKPD